MKPKAKQRSAYLNALLDGIEAKDAFVAAHVAAGLEHLRDDIAAVVSVAAGKGATDADVERVLRRRKLKRTELLLRAAIAREADELAHDILVAKAEAVASAGARTGRIGPIRKADLEERRQERGE